MATQARGRGFWRGFFTGLILAVLGAVGLAIAFPPLQPPEVPEGSLQAPAAPGRPEGIAEPEAGGLLPPSAPAPLVPGLPEAGEPEAAPSGAGSPSRVEPTN
jgi:hypothetical protein